MEDVSGAELEGGWCGPFRCGRDDVCVVCPSKDLYSVDRRSSTGAPNEDRGAHVPCGISLRVRESLWKGESEGVGDDVPGGDEVVEDGCDILWVDVGRDLQGGGRG